LNRILSSLRLQ